ncbi:cbb3-type cytochrome c oxidase subunit 3 [Devosia algicola]|uniref:Cbb3-type cytochrome c oxidase subunit 3 n=1 Tax=Devosia algicola TaxID=3026418 RepID=A0ABY7YP98_9HYPH|nr:cbb3-type cytochrome c oxidase subunit 3 [Devosia algicola]WDR02859.1 cbb3-type cytochrome c oxidase subunit 3 [Devosia algicola]
MPFDHDTLVGFSKSFGLFYLIAMSIGVLIYTFWPSNQKRFQQAAKDAISNEDDKPWH